MDNFRCRATVGRGSDERCQNGCERGLEIGQESLENLRSALLRDYPDLGESPANELAAMTLSQLDGSFVAAMAGETALTPRVLSDAVHTLAKSMSANASIADVRRAR